MQLFREGEVWDAGRRGQHRIKGAFGRGRNRRVMVECAVMSRTVDYRALAVELENAHLVPDPGVLRRAAWDVTVPDFRRLRIAADVLRERARAARARQSVDERSEAVG